MRKILIVIDMQNDFVTGSLGSKEAQAIVPNVVNKIKCCPLDTTLIFTRDTHFENYLSSLEGTMLPVIHCQYETEGWEIIPELSEYVSKSKYVFDKCTFGYEDWNRYFAGAESVEFELCGLCTDICVVSNALALRMFYPNAKITVDASCCAGVTPESHQAALTTMKMCQINVIGE